MYKLDYTDEAKLDMQRNLLGYRKLCIYITVADC